jgi:hypothetical protein
VDFKLNRIVGVDVLKRRRLRRPPIKTMKFDPITNFLFPPINAKEIQNLVWSERNRRVVVSLNLLGGAGLKKIIETTSPFTIIHIMNSRTFSSINILFGNVDSNGKLLNEGFDKVFHISSLFAHNFRSFTTPLIYY